MVPLLAGWMAAKMICVILLVCEENDIMATLTNIDHLACVHHIPLVVTSPVKRKNLRRYTLHCPSRKSCVPHLDPTRAVELLFFIFQSRGTRMLRSGKNHPGNSASLQASLIDFQDGESGGCAGLLAEMRLASQFRSSRVFLIVFCLFSPSFPSFPFVFSFFPFFRVFSFFPFFSFSSFCFLFVSLFFLHFSLFFSFFVLFPLFFCATRKSCGVCWAVACSASCGSSARGSLFDNTTLCTVGLEPVQRPPVDCHLRASGESSLHHVHRGFAAMLRYHAQLVSLVECVGLVVGRVAVVLWSRCCELPTASLANQARVYCGY